MSEYIKISKWNVPSKLFNDYVKFSIIANTYLDENTETPSNTDYERFLRWNICVQQKIKIHREICNILNIPYSEDFDDEFYTQFHREVNKQTKLKG